MAEEKLTMFDIHNSLINKKQYSDIDVERLFAPFMSMKWLSVRPQLAMQLNFINSIRGSGRIPKLAEYKALKNIVKLPKNTYIKIPKADKNADIIIMTLIRHFNISKTVAEQYIDILGGEKVLEILELHARRNEKQIDLKSTKEVLDLRKAITAKKKELLQIKGTK